MSVVETHRRELEKLGEYVIRANASTGWFAVFPKKLEKCRSKAREHARSDFNLVVYRTKSREQRDHWSIPFSFVRDEFADNFLTHSEVNGSDRWNCTFRDGVLHVTHTSRDVDCSRFYGARLIIESDKRDAALPEEILEDDSFSEGNVTRIWVNRYERDADARRQCIKLHGAVCTVCGFDFEVVYGPSLRGFIHVHHVTPLHQIRGRYDVSPKTDLVPVCPNCHAVIHSKREPFTIEEVRQLFRKGGEPVGPQNGLKSQCPAAVSDRAGSRP